MSSTLRAVQFRPSAYLPLDDLNDRSGFGNNATATGTPKNGIPLAWGVSNSKIVDNSNFITIPTNLFKAGLEQQTFTITAIFRTVKRSDTTDWSPQQVLGHSNSTANGIQVNGTVVSFGIQLAGAIDVIASYDIQVPRRVHVMGVYTGEKVILYIDSVLVAQTALTEEQKLLQFSNSSGNLLSGKSSGTDALMINGIGVYARALDSDTINTIYNSAYRYKIPDSFAETEGRIYRFSSEPVRDKLVQIIDNASGWSTGVIDNVVIDGDRIIPAVEGTTSKPGFWIGMFPLNSITTTLYGVNVTWDGVGVDVEVSSDTLTWETVYRGKNITLIPPGTSTTTIPVIYVRASFPGSIVDDTSFISSVTVTAYPTSVVNSTSAQLLNEREVRFSGKPLDIREEIPAQDLSENWGAKTYTGTGTLWVRDNSTATEPPFVPKTIEVWLKIESGTSVTTSTQMAAATNVYANGQTYSALAPGEWTILHYVRSAGFDNNVSFSGPVQLSRIVYYPTAMTQAEINAVLASYFGTDAATLPTDTGVTITQPSDSASLSSHDWTMFTTSAQ